MAQMPFVMSVTLSVLAVTLPSSQAATASNSPLNFAVRDALAAVERVLGSERVLVLPGDTPHTYADKYAFVEAQVRVVTQGKGSSVFR